MQVCEMTFRGAAAAHSPAHRGLLDTATQGWTALRVEHIACAVNQDAEFDLPGQDEHRTVVTLSGKRFLEAQSGSRWRGAVYCAGAIGMSAPGVSSSLRWRSLSEREALEIHVTVPGPTLRRVAEDLGKRTQVLPDGLLTDDPLLERMATTLLQAARVSTPSLYVESAAEFLATHLFTRVSTPNAWTPEPRIHQSLQYLRDNLHRELSLGEIAESAGLSRYHFLRTFKQVTGHTPFIYLRNLRIDEARRHLKQGSRSIAEIAHLCGFSSQGALSTTFRRVTGVSPSQYRAQARG
jgi:AraC family transcriptional regulator